MYLHFNDKNILNQMLEVGSSAGERCNDLCKLIHPISTFIHLLLWSPLTWTENKKLIENEITGNIYGEIKLKLSENLHTHKYPTNVLFLFFCKK